MSSSSYLGKMELHALERIGDIYLPGDDDFPSFSDLGCIHHVDKMLRYTAPADIRKLRLLLLLLRPAPDSLLTWLIKKGDDAYMKPGAVSALLRELEFGLGGMVKSLYFSGNSGEDYRGALPLDIMGFDPGMELK